VSPRGLFWSADTRLQRSRSVELFIIMPACSKSSCYVVKYFCQSITFICLSLYFGRGWLSRHRDYLRSGTVRGSNPGGGEIFRTRPDRSWGPRSLLYSRYRVSFPEVKWPACGFNHPPRSSAGVKERVDL
jgi:hypothetical protein